MTALTHTYGNRRSIVRASDARMKRLDYLQSSRKTVTEDGRASILAAHESTQMRRRNNRRSHSLSQRATILTAEPVEFNVNTMVPRAYPPASPSSSRYASSDDVALGDYDPLDRSKQPEAPVVTNQRLRGDGISMGGTPNSICPSQIPPDLPSGSTECAGSPELNTIDRLLSSSAATYDANEKVMAMLAATSALKPASSSAATTKSVRPRMFVRVSDAWDRIASPRGSVDEIKTHRKLRKQSYSPANRATFEIHAQQKALSTVEMRVNEGHNLSRQKVQKIVGGSIARKPVPRRRSQSRQDISEEHLESMELSVDSVLLLQLPVESENEDLFPTLSDPFASEPDFESHLDDSILSSTPSGASTPRNLTSQIGSSRPVEQSSPTKQPIKAGQKHERLHWNLLEGQSPSASHAQHIPAAEKRVKKHPSPSKNTLEDLEMAFRGYSKFHGQILGDAGRDELASSFVTPQVALATRDPNRSIGSDNPHSLSNPNMYRHAMSQDVPKSQSVSKSRYAQIRKAHSFRSNFGVGCDKIDELCV